MLGILDVEVLLPKQPFADSVVDPIRQAIAESVLHMVAGFTMAGKTAEFRSVLRDGLSALLVPLVETISFHDDQMFWRKVSFESGAGRMAHGRSRPVASPGPAGSAKP